VDGDGTGGDIELPPQPARTIATDSSSHKPAHRILAPRPLPRIRGHISSMTPGSNEASTASAPVGGLVFGPNPAVLDTLPVVRTAIGNVAGLPGVAVAVEDEGLQVAREATVSVPVGAFDCLAVVCGKVQEGVEFRWFPPSGQTTIPANGKRGPKAWSDHPVANHG